MSFDDGHKPPSKKLIKIKIKKITRLNYLSISKCTGTKFTTYKFRWVGWMNFHMMAQHIAWFIILKIELIFIKKFQFLNYKKKIPLGIPYIWMVYKEINLKMLIKKCNLFHWYLSCVWEYMCFLSVDNFKNNFPHSVQQKLFSFSCISLWLLSDIWVL